MRKMEEYARAEDDELHEAQLGTRKNSGEHHQKKSERRFQDAFWKGPGSAKTPRRGGTPSGGARRGGS
jgi:hypothetical protein